MDDDTTDAAWHQQELESRRWQDELTHDPDYFRWLAHLANTHEQEMIHGDYGI